MNILFIEPPYYRLIGEIKRWSPIGLLYLASILEEAGNHVIVYNADADYSSARDQLLSYSDRHFLTKHILDSNSITANIFNELQELVIDFKPDLVGISVKSDCVPIVIKIMDMIKDVCGTAKIILGGPHFSVDRECLYFEAADKIFIGEAEGQILNYVESICNNKRHKRKSTVFASRDFSLDNLPLLDLKFLPRFQLNNVDTINKQMLSASRGCPFTCYFCYKSIDVGGSVRYLTGARIVQNMLKLKNEYLISKFYIVDDTFGINQKQLSEMRDSIKFHDLDIRWTCMSHVKVLNEQKIVLMKEMGCVAVHLGIESGSDRILKKIGKNVTVADIKRCVALLHKYKIEVRVFMIVGLPFENDEDLVASEDLMANIKPSEIAAQVYQPYPNTILYNQLLQDDTIIEINWPQFIRCNINYNLYKGQASSEVDARIEHFLHFADSWNTNH